MKKKILLTVTLLTVLFLVSGCMMVTGSKLESMFGTGKNANSSTNTVNPSAEGTVTITKEEYDYLNSLTKFSELEEIYETVQEYFYFETDTKKMLEYAAKGLMAGMDDPYSFYYSPEEYAQMQEDDEGKYVGIGVLILTDNKTGVCTISRVFKGSPAEEAGVMRGDILYKVGEDLLVTSETINEAVSIMRGEPGTKVDVTFLRNDEEITFNVERREVQTNQVESTMLEPGIGYIAMYQFAGEAEKEFASALDELLSQDAKSLIIDLRDNTGGWVEQARIIADLFMDKGELCYLVDKDGNEEHSYLTYDGKTEIPITILVNEMTASSSEILTGALRDCANATVVGTKTFGKGIVQAVLDVGNSGAGFQLTILEYFTPKGNKVHEIGITPDVVIERPEDDSGTYDFADLNKDIQLKKALEVAKEKLQTP